MKREERVRRGSMDRGCEDDPVTTGLTHLQKAAAASTFRRPSELLGVSRRDGPEAIDAIASELEPGQRDLAVEMGDALERKEFGALLWAIPVTRRNSTISEHRPPFSSGLEQSNCWPEMEWGWCGSAGFGRRT